MESPKKFFSPPPLEEHNLTSYEGFLKKKEEILEKYQRNGLPSTQLNRTYGG